jgi:hypothetical protein
MSNQLTGLRDYPPPKSWPEAGNSARVFAQQMDDWFSEFNTLSGNNLFNTNESIKKSFFIKNVTGNANTTLSLWSQNNSTATYNNLYNKFIEFNTDSQQQTRLQEELSKSLRPDLSKPLYRDAIAEYINKFNQRVRELDEVDKHNLQLYFMQQLTGALRGAIDAQINVMSDTDKSKVDLSKCQQLALLLAANSQSSWDDTRRRYNRKSGVRIHSVMTSHNNNNNNIDNSNNNINNSNDNNTNNTNNINAIYQQRLQKRPRITSPIFRLVKQYCFTHNLCTWCKKPRHEWVNGKCGDPVGRIDDDTLNKFKLSQQYNISNNNTSSSQYLNMKGR